MKKLLLLAAVGLVLQATPAFAEDHEGGSKKRGEHKGEMFAKHDTNGDGSISEAEFLTHAKAKFAKKDTNSDGSISKEEAKAAHEAKRAEMKEKRKGMKEKMKERRSEKRGE
jgi:Ca2+-binding EF-hand superfamily protein